MKVLLYILMLVAFAAAAYADDGDYTTSRDQYRADQQRESDDNAGMDRAYAHDAASNGDSEAARSWNASARSEGGY